MPLSMKLMCVTSLRILPSQKTWPNHSVPSKPLSKKLDYLKDLVWPTSSSPSSLVLLLCQWIEKPWTFVCLRFKQQQLQLGIWPSKLLLLDWYVLKQSLRIQKNVSQNSKPHQQKSTNVAWGYLGCGLQPYCKCWYFWRYWAKLLSLYGCRRNSTY